VGGDNSKSTHFLACQGTTSFSNPLSLVTFGHSLSSSTERILTTAHRTNLAQICNASPPPKRYTWVVRRRERSRGQDPPSEHLRISINIYEISQKRANKIPMPASQLVFLRNEGESDANYFATRVGQLINQADLVTVSAPWSCHLPERSPGGSTFCSPSSFLNSSVSRSIPLKVRAYKLDSNPLAISARTCTNTNVHTHTHTLSLSLSLRFERRKNPFLAADLH